MLKLIIRFFLFIFLLVIIAIAASFRGDIPLEKLKEKYTNHESRFVNINGMEVHYRDEGSGMPLLLIHGTAASLHTWDAWADTLKDHFRVIRADMPAFGLTGPDPEHNYEISRYVDFTSALLKELKVDSCYIAGNSLGGLIAWNYALREPEKVKKMILIDAAGYRMADDPPPTLAFRIARTPGLRWLVRWISPKFLIKQSLTEVYADDKKVTDELVNRYYELLRRPGNRKAFIERVKNSKEQNVDLIPRIRIPVMIQWGLKDTWIPVTHAYAFQKALPKSYLSLYDNLGHVPMEEGPKETVQDALDFLID